MLYTKFAGDESDVKTEKFTMQKKKYTCLHNYVCV